eukprot:CAMPEP_0183732264 /NCGR_PEP_ID=MMETSP0737-20130205/37987_1 /TAXON_ID=385413 /ORGANISM="Thalassiosira miniscula, Strain CCMP1093" /LENGTH=387 /DNA_ID=CAMNT_0025965227 /DNA_START=94 /DNA_END=1254 /DNA_ORIENTATION=-
MGGILYSIRILFILLALPHQRVAADRFCGVDSNDSNCWQPCQTDSDCCSPAQKCYEAGASCGSSDLSGTNHFFCGSSWCDAAYTCGTPCPEKTECPEGQYCFADIPCDSESTNAPPKLPNPPTASPYQFCGNSLQNAKDNCWQPCPRGKSDCCFGQGCYDTSSADAPGPTCTNSDYSGSNHYFCGSSWCDAAYSCGRACPGGTNEECGNGQNCYADVPCSSDGLSSPPPNVEPPPSIFSMYCGRSAEDAATTCWNPCRNDDDCCLGQTCFEGVSSCPYPDYIGSDHYFCGKDYCDAGTTCPAPCRSGYDAECPNGLRCVPNVPCDANLKTLDYGLPRSVMRLAQQYNSDASQGQTNSAAPSSGSASVIVGLLFALCLVSIVYVNSVW